MASESEVTGAPWIYFVSNTYKKSALSWIDHCTWYLSTSVRRSIHLGGPGMATTWEIWMLREVHNYDRGSTYRNDGEC